MQRLVTKLRVGISYGFHPRYALHPTMGHLLRRLVVLVVVCSVDVSPMNLYDRTPTGDRDLRLGRGYRYYPTYDRQSC